VIKRDIYEWEGITIKGVRKHIFLRDIHKQWYLTGINSNIHSPVLLLDFLRKECDEQRIITVGSSAGGYAAVLYGSLLGAEAVYSFNGQMELCSLLTTSSYGINPLVFKFAESERAKYYDLRHFISKVIQIYYFYSINSDWDSQQAAHVRDLKLIGVGFWSSRHGIPFIKGALPDLWKVSHGALLNLSKSTQHPLMFSIRLSGYVQVIRFMVVDVVYKSITRFVNSRLPKLFMTW
jgi:hypothetical protein